MSGEFDWKRLMGASERPQLSTLGLNPVHVKDSLYQLGGREFAIAPWQFHAASGQWAFCVSCFLWSSCLAAVRGLILRNPTDEPVTRCEPPDALLLAPGCRSFEAILEAAASGRFGDHSAGPYPGCAASIFDRTFLVSAGRFDYYFSSGIESWSGEIPIVVRWHASDSRWLRLEGQPG